MLRTAPKTHKKTILSDGKHKVMLHSILEIEGRISLKFDNQKGFIHCSPVNIAETLSKLAYMAGVEEGELFKESDLLGLKCMIEVEYKHVKSIYR